jgi:hypothetical protein
MEKLNHFTEFFRHFGVEVATFCAGIAGAFVSVRKKQLRFVERLATVFSGGLIATYITPLFLNFVNIDSNYSYGIAFVIGSLGMGGLEFIIKRVIPHKNEDETN